MYFKFKNFLVKNLPATIVVQIRKVRRFFRLSKRYLINRGEDFIYKINTEKVNFVIYINPYLNGGVDDDIYTQGSWEPEIVELISKYLPIGGTFVDIGANIGYHTLCAASLVGENGKVHAFEPLPRLYNQMSNSVSLNGFKQVTLHNLGLSDKEETGHLSLVDENVGASSLSEVSKERSVHKVVEVKLEKLDSFEMEFQVINLIKIDIEGSEYEALKGAESLIKKYKPVLIIEFSPSVYEKDFPGKSLELFNFIKELGYEINVVGEKIDIEKNLRESNFESLHVNLLCLPSDIKTSTY